MNYRIWKEIDDLRELKKGEKYVALVTKNGLEIVECEITYFGNKWCYNDLSGALYTIENVRNIVAIEVDLEDILHNKKF